MSSKPVLKLDWCSHEAAKWACEHWHYSKTMPAAKSAKIGVWEGGAFIGALIFTSGSGAACDGRRYGLRQNFDICELQRVALAAHVHPVTRMMAVAFRMLKQQSPALRAVVSFADPSQRHHGGIYQASNWIYTGLSSSTIEHRLSDGRWVHARVIAKQWGKKELAATLATGETRKQPGKHRYLMPLDAAMRVQIAPLAKPYPKRVRGEPGHTLHQQGEGGATPTRALQLTDAGGGSA